VEGNWKNAREKQEGWWNKKSGCLGEDGEMMYTYDGAINRGARPVR
jgi:hypothetical protein